MQHSVQLQQSKKIFDLADRRTTMMADHIYKNPVSDYICRDQARQEWSSLFMRVPINLGLSCRLPNAGDFFTHDYTGTPIIVARAKDGKIYAMVNACRHRGARIAEDYGNSRIFSCPYHAWSYELDGTFRSRPSDASFEGLNAMDCGLIRLPAEERYGMIWVLPDPRGELDLENNLAGVVDDLESYQFDRYEHFETREIRPRMNWKLVVDTFLETYHVNVLHAKSLPFLHANLATMDAFGKNLRFIAPRRSFDDMRKKPESEWDLIRHSVIVYVLFPNTVCIMQGDHLETWHVFPDGDNPDASVTYLSLYTPDPVTSGSARRHWERNMDLAMQVVHTEDFPVGEGIQKGFHAAGRDDIIFGRNEPALQHYHRSIRDSLSAEQEI